MSGRPDGGGRRSVYLQAGEVFASAEPTAVTTILGSCVAVCLFDLDSGAGGVNHYLLPLAVAREPSPRFGNIAIARLIEEVLAAGARRTRLRAKVFGGACVVDAFRSRGHHLGEENVALALRTLEAAGVTVLDRDVLGNRGRKLVFHCDTGDAWVRAL